MLAWIRRTYLRQEPNGVRHADWSDQSLPNRETIIRYLLRQARGKNDDLWKETNIGEIEDIIWFLNDLKNALFQTYENGRALKIVQGEPDVNFYEDDFSHLLDQILEKQN